MWASVSSGTFTSIARPTLRRPRALRNALIAAGLAAEFPYSAAFVLKRLRTKQAALEAKWIFELAYEHVRGRSVPALLLRVDAKAALELA